MSDTPLMSWSHSRVETFKKCPLMFYELSVVKSIKFEQSEAMREGERVHKMLEHRCSKGVALPVGYSHLEPVAASICRAPGQLFTEQEIALNADLKTTGWFAKDAWVRVIIDVMKKTDTTAFMGDYKTGKPTFDEHQLKLFAAVGFMVYPSLEQITTAYIWLKTGTLDPKTYLRGDLPRMWDELLQEPAKMQEAATMNNWPAKPGRWCTWCLVNKYGRCPDAASKYRGD